jgi:1,4-alpha-glucan branching enzyme
VSTPKNTVTEPGMFSLVLHSHLPWLANHGRWPVGEEWLYQSWAGSYLPLTRMLSTLAEEGRTDLLSLGITPVLAAQLDDPHCLSGMHHWLGNWQLRAHEAHDRELSIREHRAASKALHEFETHWRHGGSTIVRKLVDSRAVELLGGPLAHPFQPLMDPLLREFSLMEGLSDALTRWGFRPGGIWAPECAYAPGMETDYAAAGVTHFMVDGPALRGDTALGRPVRESEVVAFGRDLDVSYRVWSPKSGYPGHAAYRDFHTYDHATGLKHARVTGRSVDSADKASYDPDLAATAIDRHVEDFVETVRLRLRRESSRIGRPALVVAAFDTELFGHWWFEGPQWLEKVLRALPEAGIEVGTLETARTRGFVGEPVQLEKSSWGSGKDWRVWDGDAVSDLVALNAEIVATALGAVDADREQATSGRPELRNRANDQMLRETLMAIASDWAFMVSKDSAAGYARQRAHVHAHALREIADAVSRGHHVHAEELAQQWNRADGLFPALDARRFPRADRGGPVGATEGSGK